VTKPEALHLPVAGHWPNSDQSKPKRTAPVLGGLPDKELKIVKVVIQTNSEFLLRKGVIFI
jgi:hypothetical protein